MIFHDTKIPGAYVIEPERFEDSRGFFANAWTQEALAERGIRNPFVEGHISFNPKRGTLRGLHFQLQPRAQAKLIRCTSGAMYDVGLDLRPESPTYRQWFALELSARNRLMVYLPAGMAHGFQTLAEDTEVFYTVSDNYAPEYATGVRWNDPAFGIEWPHEENRLINSRDQQYPDFAISLNTRP
jgi:dTDP-4-dehydrorhamnose 3,5-epimerase